MTVKVFSADEVRQDIRWVVLPRDPCHFDLLLADGSLQPEERHRHVPDLPDASPPADAPASRAIRVDPYLQVDPEILCHGLHRETLWWVGGLVGWWVGGLVFLSHHQSGCL